MVLAKVRVIAGNLKVRRHAELVHQTGFKFKLH
jgi:hypothetical protein